MTDLTSEAATLLAKAADKIQNFDLRARKTGARFNVFDVLDRATDEVKGHSAFLAELLSPGGSHGQGDRFLGSFLKILQEQLTDDPAMQGFAQVLKPANWTVDCERFVPSAEDCDGRIDIVIESNEHLLIIENKVYAADQPAQLSRYHAYAENRGKKWFLFYLTLDGAPPSKDSLRTLPSEQVLCISYAQTIRTWLKQNIESDQLPLRLRETVSQYGDLILRLSGHGSSEGLTMNLARLLNTPNEVRAAFELTQALEEKKIQVMLSFWEQLEQALLAVGIQPIRGRGQWYDRRKIESYFRDRKNRETHFGITLQACDMKDQTVALRIEVNWNVYFCWVILKDDEVITKIEGFPRLLDHAKANGMTSDSTHLWKYPDGKRLNFREFTDPCIELADERRMGQSVHGVAVEAKSMIERLCELPK